MGIIFCRGARAVRLVLIIVGLLAVGARAQTQPGTAEALRTRANSGDAAAMGKLGALYLDGGPVPRDPAGEGLSWLRKAADAGDGGAQLLVGQMLLHGLFVPTDMEAAKNYLLKAT